MRSYALDTKAAREGDSNSNRITEPGAYTGIFTKAKAVKSAKGTEGIEFTFKSADELEAGFLTVWTYNAEGKPIYGFKQLNAIMTCASVKELQPETVQIKEYNFDSRTDEMVNATIFPALMHTPIGLILQKELYTKGDGNDGERMLMSGFFNADSKKTASEILDKIDIPKLMEAQLRNLKDKDSRRSQQVEPSHGNPPDAGSVDFDDDIPF